MLDGTSSARPLWGRVPARPYEQTASQFANENPGRPGPAPVSMILRVSESFPVSEEVSAAAVQPRQKSRPAAADQISARCPYAYRAIYMDIQVCAYGFTLPPMLIGR